MRENYEVAKLHPLAVIGPGTTHLTNAHANQKYIFMIDHVPYTIMDNNSDGNFFKNTILDLFSRSNIDLNQKIFFSTYYFRLEDFPNIISVASNFHGECVKFIKHFGLLNTVPDLNINSKFSFISNKPRYQRMLASRVIANMFDANEIKYTYNSPSDNKIQSASTDILLNKKEYQFKDIFLSENRYYISEFDTLTNNCGITSTISNVINYEFLFAKIFYNSATSLISEPSFFEQGCSITEKTIMSFYAGHFPIWLGSYKLPETVKTLGFDIFDDFIDHSYQYVIDPVDRLIQAIVKNYDFLNDIKMQKQLRNENLHRLNNNLKLVQNPYKLGQTILNLNVGSNRECTALKVFNELNIKPSAIYDTKFISNVGISNKILHEVFKT